MGVLGWDVAERWGFWVGCDRAVGVLGWDVREDGPMASIYDVVIVGGGIAGLSLASVLAGKCSVALLEAEQELAFHTSSRSARQLIPSYGPPVVQELTMRTLELLKARDDDAPEPVLTPRSFMLVGDEETVRPWSSSGPAPRR